MSSNPCLVVSEKRNNPMSFSVMIPTDFLSSKTINLLRLFSNNFLITSDIVEFFRIETGLLQISIIDMIYYKSNFYKNRRIIFIDEYK